MCTVQISHLLPYPSFWLLQSLATFAVVYCTTWSTLIINIIKLIAMATTICVPWEPLQLCTVACTYTVH